MSHLDWERLVSQGIQVLISTGKANALIGSRVWPRSHEQLNLTLFILDDGLYKRSGVSVRLWVTAWVFLESR